MKDKQTGAVASAFFGVAVLGAGAVACFVMYRMTRYLPLLMLGLTLSLPGVFHLLLAVQGVIPHISRTERTAVQREAAVDENGTASVGQSSGHSWWRILTRGVRSAVLWLAEWLEKRRAVLLTLCLTVSFAALQVLLWRSRRFLTSLYQLGYLYPLLLLVLFLLLLVADKWAKYAGESQRETHGYFEALLTGLRSALILCRLPVLLTAVAMCLKLLTAFEGQRYLIWVIIAVFSYASLFLALSVISRLIKRELLSHPALIIPVAFAGRQSGELSVLTYLETHTGITMRSLWSLRFVKKLIPYTVAFGVAVLWLGTGIVQVSSFETGVVYRFGRLREDMLTPGLHLTLPWPFDKVALYRTDTVERMTIGYRSAENSDNVWTENHGGSEYKLLLGGGNELVSINLRLEYRIGDLGAYLKNSGSPEKIMEAKAYELITESTIGTDLETLLSTDRSAFALKFQKELTARLEKCSLGLEVVSVVLESIHPPVEIASTYQEVVSAGIRAEKTILDAEAQAAVKLAAAQATYDSALGAANADRFGQIAEAQAAVAEFMAGVEADQTDSQAYRYYKYLSAMEKAYGASRLVLIGDGIDSSCLYFGASVKN